MKTYGFEQKLDEHYAYKIIKDFKVVFLALYADVIDYWE